MRGPTGATARPQDRQAGELFKRAREVLISQYPMLILMVGYTMTSLWILAQPITSGG